MKPISVGIIGTGFIANVAHLPSLISLKDVEIVALCDPNKENLLSTSNTYNLGNTYTDHKEMLRREELDCAFCLTAPRAHTEIVADCLENGVDVFCEKPMAWTMQEAKEIIRASESSGRWVQVGYNRRFTPVYKKAKGVFQSRQVKSCVAEKSNELRTPPQYFIRTQLIHLIDTLNWLCGEAIDIEAKMVEMAPERPDTICAVVRYEKNKIALLMADNSGGAWIERLEVYGDGYTVWVDAPFRTTIFTSGKSEIYEPCAQYHYPWHKLYGFQQEDEHFVACVRKDAQPSPSAKDGLKSLDFIDKLRRKLGLSPL